LNVKFNLGALLEIEFIGIECKFEGKGETGFVMDSGFFSLEQCEDYKYDGIAGKDGIGNLILTRCPT